VSDADTRRLSAAPAEPPARVRPCEECSEPVPPDRSLRSVFCSLRCANRNRKRRHSQYVTVSMAIDEATLQLRWERGPIGTVWGVPCRRDIAEVLREEARRPFRRRRRIPFPKRDDDGATLDV